MEARLEIGMCMMQILRYLTVFELRHELLVGIEKTSGWIISAAGRLSLAIFAFPLQLGYPLFGSLRLLLSQGKFLPAPAVSAKRLLTGFRLRYGRLHNINYL